VMRFVASHKGLFWMGLSGHGAPRDIGSGRAGPTSTHRRCARNHHS